MPDKAKPDDPAQSQRFIDMALEVEATEGLDKFDGTFQQVVQLPYGRAVPKNKAGKT